MSEGASGRRLQQQFRATSWRRMQQQQRLRRVKRRRSNNDDDDERRSNAYLALHSLLLMSCLIAMSWQVALMARMYFEYHVTTTIRMMIPDSVRTAALHVCTRYTDVLDFDSLSRVKGPEWRYTQAAEAIVRYQASLTVAEIFRYTPREQEVLQEVAFRSGESFERHILPATRLQERFTVHKYLNLEHVCYKIAHRKEEKRPFDYYAVTPVAPGMVWEVFFNKSNLINRSHQLKILITTATAAEYPFRSIGVAPVLRRDWNESRRAAVNRFAVSKLRLTVDLLHQPFESDCMEYTSLGFNSDAECTQSCLRSLTIAAWNKLPFSVIVNDSQDERHIISLTDLRDPAFLQQLLSLDRQCQHTCRRPSCHYGTALTVAVPIADNSFVVRLNVPSEPWVYVRALPLLTLIQFLTSASGIISTYTGLAILSFSPDRLYSAIHHVRRWLPLRLASRSDGRQAGTRNTRLTKQTGNRDLQSHRTVFSSRQIELISRTR